MTDRGSFLRTEGKVDISQSYCIGIATTPRAMFRRPPKEYLDPLERMTETFKLSKIRPGLGLWGSAVRRSR